MYVVGVCVCGGGGGARAFRPGPRMHDRTRRLRVPASLLERGCVRAAVPAMLRFIYADKWKDRAPRTRSGSKNKTSSDSEADLPPLVGYSPSPSGVR